MSSKITITENSDGTYNYLIERNGATNLDCRDFASKKEAMKAAEAHLRCLDNGWVHEVFDGVGAIFRSHK